SASMNLLTCSVMNVPGETVLTRMPSGASVWDRFLVILVNAALAAVYAISLGDCRCTEWAEMLTIRAQSAARSSGSAARQVRTALSKISSSALVQSVSDNSSNPATSSRPGPTVLITTFAVSQQDSICWNAARTLCASARSVGTASTSGLPASRSSAAT